MYICRGREIVGDFVTSSTTQQNTEEEKAMGSLGEGRNKSSRNVNVCVNSKDQVRGDWPQAEW